MPKTDSNIKEKLKFARNWVIENCNNKMGINITRNFTLMIDDVIKDVYEQTIRDNNITEELPLVVCARGSYGRRELSLYSDVDLLFILPENDCASSEDFIKKMLYKLWDLNIDLGYAANSISEILDSAGKDLLSTTSLLEVSFIAGNKKNFLNFKNKFGEVIKNDIFKNNFVSDMINYWNKRLDKYGDSVYLLEPNVKESEGGLRDINNIQWLSTIMLGNSSLQALVNNKIINSSEKSAILKAKNFFLNIRNAIHCIEKRKIDTLSFDKQNPIAKFFGYKSKNKFLPEELFMRDYYIHAKEIFYISQKVKKAFESQINQNSHNKIKYFEDYIIEDGFISPSDPIQNNFKNNLKMMVEIFAKAHKLNYRVSNQTKDIVKQFLRKNKFNFKMEDDFYAKFEMILNKEENLTNTIYDLYESELLYLFIPEFKKLFCLVKADQYHKYTVDEHTMRAIKYAEELRIKKSSNSLNKIAKEIERWDLLILAILLHDIGKGSGRGHVLKGAQISKTILTRLKLSDSEQEIIHFLIANHLILSHTSQRRDLEDNTIIETLADRFPDVEHLKLLYVLTYCDIKAIAPDIWTDWKGQLLFELYQKLKLALQGTALSDRSQIKHDQDVLNLIKQSPLVDKELFEKLKIFINNVPERYLYLVPVEDIIRHYQMIKQLNDDTQIVWELKDNKEENYTELSTCAFDKAGELSVLCGGLASKNININSVQSFSTKDGYAINIFNLTDLKGNKLPEGFVLDRLYRDINKIFKSEMDPEQLFKQIPKFKAPHGERLEMIETSVKLSNDISNKFSVIEVKTFDKPGLLYKITSAITKNHLFIFLAMITTEAYRVVDVFYVTDLNNEKITNQKEIDLIEKSIREKIDEE